MNISRTSCKAIRIFKMYGKYLRKQRSKKEACSSSLAEFIKAGRSVYNCWYRQWRNQCEFALLLLKTVSTKS